VLCLLASTAAAAALGSGRGVLTAELLPTEPSGTARGAFTARLTPVGDHYHRLDYRLEATGLTSPVTAVHLHLGPPGTRPVLHTLCTGRDPGSDARCRLPAPGYLWLANRELESMATMGAFVDVHTREHPKGELTGQLAGFVTSWRTARRTVVRGYLAEVTAADRRPPVAARLTLTAPRGPVLVKVWAKCRTSSGSGPWYPGMMGVADWHLASDGRPIRGLLAPDRLGNPELAACTWKVQASGVRGRLELVVETLRSVTT
jgi:hypothetical protein